MLQGWVKKFVNRLVIKFLRENFVLLAAILNSLKYFSDIKMIFAINQFQAMQSVKILKKKIIFLF